MTNVVIAVSTANRAATLDRCVTAAVAGCEIARQALWLVIDDSSSARRQATRDVVQAWRGRGLRLVHIDAALEEAIAAAMPSGKAAEQFLYLTSRPDSYRVPGSRNMALLAGLSLGADVIILMDDDMVHEHHNGPCFFEWCAGRHVAESCIAIPRKRGIRDMSYVVRLNVILARDDWRRFLTSEGITAEPGLWFSTDNPLWKQVEEVSPATAVTSTDGGPLTTKPKWALSTQLMAVFDRGEEWLPFPSGHDEDLHWSFLQATLCGTPLLSVRESFVCHLPPSIGHQSAVSMVSDMIGRTVSRAFKQFDDASPKPETLTSAAQLRDLISFDLRGEAVQILKAEGALLRKAHECSSDPDSAVLLTRIGHFVQDAKQALRVLDIGHQAGEWLTEFDRRRAMFAALRRDERVAEAIRSAIRPA